MFTQRYLDKNRNGNLNVVFHYLQSNIRDSSAQESPNKSATSVIKTGCLKDFTLTNVRQTAKLSDIKSAIEKLKGYKLECMSLNLIDEAEI